MSNKYIIKSCEQIHSSDNFCWSKNILCQDCTDCVMKQIVELCKEESSIIQHKQKVKVKGLNKLADKIFELLDIEEIE